jgi:virulence factor
MLRLGVVDFDSSHAIEFTRRFNHAGVDADQCVDGARVVLGCPGTSTMSPERIPGFTAQVRSCGVEIVESPVEMIGRIDAVLVLSLCGSAHLEGVRPFLEAGFPAFVDKPFACSLGDAGVMIRLAERHNVLLYHSSALPFAEEVQEFHRQAGRVGRVNGAIAYGPAKRDAGNPGLFHYGIHAVALLFALMGTGCEFVTNEYADAAEVVTARWADGRLGTLRGNRGGATRYGFVAFCDNGIVHQTVSTRYAYRNLCRSIVAAFQSGTPPVSHAQNLEEVGFVLAALDSEAGGGGERVSLQSLT